jgi:hypothetical protein
LTGITISAHTKTVPLHKTARADTVQNQQGVPSDSRAGTRRAGAAHVINALSTVGGIAASAARMSRPPYTHPHRDAHRDAHATPQLLALRPLTAVRHNAPLVVGRGGMGTPN